MVWYLLPLLSIRNRFLVLLVALPLLAIVDVAHKDLSMNVKDLGEVGIRIVHANSPSFSDLLSSSTNGSARELAAPLQNVLYFLQNDTDRSIIAYTVKWSMTTSEGTTRTHTTNYLASEALMGRPLAGLHGVISPHAAGFISLALPPGSIPSRLMEGDDSTNQVVLDQHIARVRAKIARFSSVTVSLDSVLLDDGQFFGPDTAQSFDRIKAMMDAQRDILGEFEHIMRSGKSADTAFNRILEIAQSLRIKIDSQTTTAEFYKHHQRACAQQMLQMREMLGDPASVARIVARFHQPMLELKKQ